MNITEVDVDGRRMFVCDSGGGNPLISKDAPHSHYCIKRSEIHVEMAAFKKVAQHIECKGRVDSVIEMFGGSGWHSAVIQDVIKPSRHLAVDISPDCVKSIQMSLPQVEALMGDSYAVIGQQEHNSFDWVHADFNQFTWKRSSERRYAKALDGIFRVAKRWATITDSAVFGLCRFEKNRQSYANSIGMDPRDWHDYYHRLADIYESNWGFGVRGVYIWQRMSAMVLLEEGAGKQVSVVEVKDKVPVKVIERMQR